MKTYIKVLFEPFFDNKKLYLKHIFIYISFLILSLWSIELIRRLIESIENNFWIEVTVKYWIFTICLIIFIFWLKIFFATLRSKSLIEIQKYLNKKYLNKYILLDNEKVNNYWTWKFMNIISSWITASSEILYIILFEFWINIIAYILNIAMIAYININLVIPVIIITVLLLFSMNFTTNKTAIFRKGRQKSWEEESAQTTKILMEKFTILKNWQKDNEINKVLKIKDNLKYNWWQLHFYTKILEEWSKTIIEVWEVILVLIIWYFIYKWSSTFADMWALLFIMAIIKKNIESLNIYYRHILNFWNNFIRLINIFEEIPEIKNYETWKIYEYKNGEIKIKNLVYKYPDWKKIFDKLSLEISEKSKVAFIWKSGSWKSTLVKLILWFIEKNNWEILIDNQEIDELSKKSYYKYVGYLSQEPNVFDGTVFENIIYWNDIDIEKEELEKIIKLANCEFIYELPNWFETKIWEKGVKLSWWERQRLAIARLFLQKPNIIILDEPTSALDSFSEDSISRALDNLSKWKTMITIAHRLQTIKKSDLIFVFEKWKIIDKWNHKDLLKNSEIYKKLVDLQNGEINN